jgi:two-component system chemotaxis sensor kinase CheA
MDDRFKATYFEECEDRMAEAEQGLSAMLDGDHSSETVNLVFRSIHSVKGGAGAFGFDAIVNFAHDFETTLDFVREGKLTPNREMCDLFLSANDIVAEMIEHEKSGQTIDPEMGKDVRERLQSLIGIKSSDKKTSEETKETHRGGMATWAITFRPDKNILKTGNDPIFIIRALKELGELTVTLEDEALPTLENNDCESCYLSWRLILKTEASEEDIKETFDFVEDLCELDIQKQSVPLNNESEKRAPASPEDVLQNLNRKEDRDAVENAVIGSQSIRVDLQRIDHLVNLVGEMVISQSMLQERVRWLPQEAANSIENDVESLSRHMRDLQDSVMSVRAQQIKSVFTRIPRIIREVSRACGKDVRLTTFGEDTEVDKTVLENLIDPLTHMIRNSVDHGIEKPEVREAAGKKPYGTIQLSARHKSGRILIEVQDDGAGINREVVLKKAIDQGLVDADANLSDNEIDNLIFRAGFSTAQSVSEVSGRGVGMDVVRKNITNLGGRISIHSIPGQGCTMTLSLPLTLAVMDGMVVSSGSQRFVLPTVNIIESFQPSKGQVELLANEVSVIKARGEYVRILPLYSLFHIDDSIIDPEEALIILAETDEGDRIAVMVDDVLGQQQVVIKSLETNFNAVAGIAAATILGNGDVALILDIPGLVEKHAVLDSREKNPSNVQTDNALELEGYTKTERSLVNE